MTPTTQKPKEFEKNLLDAAARTPGMTMSRYGVMASLVGGEWRPIQSYPDFEGVVIGGAQFIIEAKVTNKAAFALNPKLIKQRQVEHMLERASYGVPCWVVIHYEERQGKTFHDPAETLAIPVNARLGFWQAFVDACKEAKRTGKPFVSPGSITRDYAGQIGTKLEWTAPGNARKPLPDLGALLGLTSDMTLPAPVLEGGQS